jgi:hypothetical protein
MGAAYDLSFGRTLAFAGKELMHHELKLVHGEPDGEFQVWILAKPGTRVHLAQITFTPEGTVIQGDVIVDKDANGLCSTYGIGRQFFLNCTSMEHLCSKFLAAKWVPELIEDELRFMLDDVGPVRQFASELLEEENQHLLSSEEAFMDAWASSGLDWSDCPSGHGYHPAEAGWLVAIQTRFRELYEPAEKS